MNDNKSKKVILPTAIATLVLIVMVVGATYAYINVNVTDNFDTKKITASVQPMGSVVITGSDLTMNLSRTQVFTPESDTTYYATSTGVVSDSPADQTIATATVTGEGTYTCDYTISVTATGGLFTKAVGIGEGLLVLTVNSSTNFEHDFNTAWGNDDAKTITGTLTGLTSSNSGTVTAQLKYVNSKEKDQSALAGKSGTITFTIKSFSCTPTA